MQNRLLALFLKKMEGGLNNSELLEFNQYLVENPDYHEYLQQTDSFLHSANVECKEDDTNALIAFEKLNARINLEASKVSQNLPIDNTNVATVVKFKPSVSKWWYFAASFLAVCLAAFFYVNNFEESNKKVENFSEQNLAKKVTAPIESTRKIQLPDGTLVWLNATSSLQYNQNFGQGTRRVQLNGEGFFQVVHNETLPFEIETSKGIVRVLGTTLNVRAFENEVKFATSLIQGKVEVELYDHPGRHYILKPSQKLVYESHADPNLDALEKMKESNVENGTVREPKITKVQVLPSDSTLAETAWLYNSLAFNNETFGDVADKMGKWYGKTILFENEDIAWVHITGTFRTQTLQQALNALKLITPFKYSFRKDSVIITYEK